MTDDLISRQAALDALDQVVQMFHYRIPGDAKTYRQYNEAWNDAIDAAETAIEALPSAQPGWIPVTEKPIASGQYIVTLKDDKGVWTDIAEWNPTFGGRWQAMFWDDDPFGEYRDISNVIAWQPLPEPWEGEKDDG